MNDTKEKHATFTPGPWGYSEGEIYRGNNPIASVIPSFGWFNKTEEDDANARLIAQSPAMYEMCKLFEECMETIDGKDGYDASYELAKVREVLAKVEGGEG
tara:strand:+ start:204 stop:506 length:303 start_codon:yes stop_codon:yes gene_type:complete